jgi:endo-1,4-beta-D-glucanase Y
MLCNGSCTAGPCGGTGGSGAGGTGTGGSGAGGVIGTGGSGTGGTGGTGTGGSGTGGTGTGGSGAGGTPMRPSACTAGPDVISDFEEGSGVMVRQGGRTGWWYTYADPSAGTLTPAPASGPIPVEASTDPAPCNRAMHSTATNHPMYTGFGATFLPAAPPSMLKMPYDLSAYSGISFRIKSGGGTQPAVYFEMLTRETQPAESGGVATVPTIDLHNNRGQMITGLTNAWTTVTVPFATLIPRWQPAVGAGMACPAAAAGVPKCQSPRFNPAAALGFQFSMYADPGFPRTGTLGTYNLWVDDVTLVRADAGLPTRPGFPNDGAVGPCAKPAGAAGKYLVRAFDNWKRTFVVSAGGTQFRVQRPENSNDTVSEGIAYGMLIAVYMNDRPLFDGLWQYWRSKSPSGRPYLMDWQINSTGGVIGSGSATDADEDAAFALLQAVKKWGTSYMADAMATINAVWASDIDAGMWVKGGSNFGQGGTGLTNPSYFAPSFYRAFAAVDTAHNWTAVANNSYTALNAISPPSDTRGLVPAWCSNNCSSPGGGNYPQETLYQYDSHRTPWRVGMDYCWNPTSPNAAAAKAYLAKTSAFFQNTAGLNGVGRIFDIYTPSSGREASGAAVNSASIIGTAAVGAMSDAAYKTFLDDAYQFVLDLSNRATLAPVDAQGRTPYSYYNATVGLLTLLTMTGNLRPL